MKYHIITHGCEMNKSDSERIAGLLRLQGWQEAAGVAEADLVVINSCSVRQSAEDRIFGDVANLVKLKVRRPDLVVAITGCMPGRDKTGRFWQKMPAVDLYFPISDLAQLPEMLAGVLAKRAGGGQKKTPTDDSLEYFAITPCYQNNYSVYLPIQTGCNKFCTYCVVPYARGREQARPLTDILAEARRALAQGAKEIVLLGQTVSSYQDPTAVFSAGNPFKNHFAALLWELNQLPELNRLRFMGAHPDDFSDEVISALALPKLVNYLHLPAQAGSDEILKKMNRHYLAADFLKIVKKVRAVRPGIALGTDLIVGFPGETLADFEKTVELYRAADFDIAYLAKYSPRSGTAAYKLADDVLPEEKERRWWVLQHLMEEIVEKKNLVYDRQVVEVLVSGCKEGFCFGNTREMKYAELAGGPELVGQVVRIKVNKADRWRLVGEAC